MTHHFSGKGNLIIVFCGIVTASIVSQCVIRDENGVLLDQIYDIPQVSNYSDVSMFRSVSHEYSIPVLIRDDKLRAKMQDLDLWNSDFLDELVGQDTEVNTFWKHDDALWTHAYGMPFSETRKRNSPFKMFFPLLSRKAQASIKAVQDLVEKYIGLPPVLNYKRLGDQMILSNTADMNMRIHCEPHGNFAFLLHGTKTFFIAHPLLSPQLRPKRGGLLHYETTAPFNASYLKEITLSAGDVLYIAPWYWHGVRYDSNDTIGLAVRSYQWLETWRNNPKFTFNIFWSMLWRENFVSSTQFQKPDPTWYG